MPAIIQANMPAIEIAFGETFRAASHAVAACAHFRLRVAIGRRSIALLVVSSMTGCTERIAGRPDNAQDKMRDLVVRRARAYLLSAKGAAVISKPGTASQDSWRPRTHQR